MIAVRMFKDSPPPPKAATVFIQSAPITVYDETYPAIEREPVGYEPGDLPALRRFSTGHILPAQRRVQRIISDLLPPQMQAA